MVAGTVSPLSVTTQESSAERFFQWSMYLLLVTGFVALMGTGKLDLPSLALVIPALLARAYSLLMRKPMVLSETVTTRLTLIYFAFFAADYFYFSRSFVIASAHMVLFSVVVKLFSVRRDRDLGYLAVLSFLMVLAAVVLTVDTLFLITFTLFLLAAMATFISMEIRRSERNTIAARVGPQKGSEFYRALALVSIALGVLTLAGSSAIFFILPRINSTGYLRSFGVQSAISSGFSQEVRLGGIGKIQQSDAVVMHVEVLSGRLPAGIKWRGIALENFDGQRWWNSPGGFRISANSTLDLTQPSLSALYSGEKPRLRRSTLSYRVVMEPLGLNVYFLAPVPLRVNDSHRAFQVGPEGSVLAASLRGIEGSESIGSYTAEADTGDPERFIRDSRSENYPPRIANDLLPPPHLDPRIAELAHTAAAGATSNYARARAIEAYLRNNFGYTLELAGETPDPLAHFLFVRKKGHCEFFASSMAIMLRTLGIPARVVNGFRGGELNDITGRYIVRERDAHSWVEVYFPEYGWVMFDPTPASGEVRSSNPWVRVGLYLDAARDLWREWIVNYDFSHQVHLSNELNTTTNHMQITARGWISKKYRRLIDRISVWQRKMANLSSWKMAAACTGLILLLALPFLPRARKMLEVARQRRDPQRAPQSVASFWYLRMLKRLAAKGVRKSPAQTPAEFAATIADPQVREDVLHFTECYERARFAESTEDAERLPDLFEELAGKR